jgi:hypothetical protein
MASVYFVTTSDPKPVGQCRGQFAAQLSRVGLLADLVDQGVLDGRQLTAHFLAALQHCQPLRGGQRIERQLQSTIEVSLERVEGSDDIFPATRTHVRIIMERADSSGDYPQVKLK